MKHIFLQHLIIRTLFLKRATDKENQGNHHQIPELEMKKSLNNKNIAT